MKRYKFHQGGICLGMTEELTDGEWVLFSDVERLQAEKEGLARRLELAEHVIDATLNDRPDSATVAARNYRRTFKALSATEAK